MTKRVGIVGAGVSGLAAVKSCLDEGFVPLCFEKSDDIGGLWDYRDEVKAGDPSVYESCVINTSKEMTCYSDFPIPDNFPNFMSHRFFKRYLDLYADNFKLRQHINFRHCVQSVEKCPDFDVTGKWEILTKNLETGKIKNDVVDFVMVCNGHLSEPSVPRLKGLESFRGRVLHTHEYKNFRGFEGKTVLVVGIGNSGADIACELSRHAKHVHVSTRRGTYITQRAANYGVPFDLVANQRWVQKLPWSLVRPFHFHFTNKKYRHADYGLSPNFKFDAGVTTISDDLPNRILVGALSVHDDVDHFTPTGAILKDGTALTNLDVVVLATGFSYSFPFLSEGTVRVEERFPYLYHLVFPPNVQPCSMAVIGLVQPFGGLPPILEMQTRAAVAVFSGRSQLPPPVEMEQWLTSRRDFLRKKYVNSPRYNLQIYYISYMDSLAKLIGCEPPLLKYLFTNPKLWYRLVFGPATPPQWRLEGPGSWAGAVEAVESVDTRVYAPMKTRKAGQGERDGLYDGWIALLGWTAGAVVILALLLFFL